MTDKPAANKKISIKTDDDLSPEDIQAKIDAQANSVGKKAEPAPAPTPAPKPASATVSIKVNTNNASTEIKKATISKPKIAPAKQTDVGEPKVTEPAVVSHRGKILNPADARKDVVVDGTDEAEKAETEVKAEPVVETKDTTESPSDKRPEIKPDSTPEAQEAEEKLTEISDDIKDREAQKEAAKDAQQAETQQPQIFDTKQYHLPIKATKHHAKSSFTTGKALLLLLLVLAVAYIAADMGMYDPGFNLPYDFF